jgi:hypothetical protein
MGKVDRLPVVDGVTEGALVGVVGLVEGVAVEAVGIAGMVKGDLVPGIGGVAIGAGAGVVVEEVVLARVAGLAVVKAGVVEGSVGPGFGVGVAVGAGGRGLLDGEKGGGLVAVGLGLPGGVPEKAAGAGVVAGGAVLGVAIAAFSDVGVLEGEGLPVVGGMAGGALAWVVGGEVALEGVAGEAVGEAEMVKVNVEPVLGGGVAVVAAVVEALVEEGLVVGRGLAVGEDGQEPAGVVGLGIVAGGAVVLVAGLAIDDAGMVKVAWVPGVDEVAVEAVAVKVAGVEVGFWEVVAVVAGSGRAGVEAELVALVAVEAAVAAGEGPEGVVDVLAEEGDGLGAGELDGLRQECDGLVVRGVGVAEGENLALEGGEDDVGGGEAAVEGDGGAVEEGDEVLLEGGVVGERGGLDAKDGVVEGAVEGDGGGVGGRGGGGLGEVGEAAVGEVEGDEGLGRLTGGELESPLLGDVLELVEGVAWVEGVGLGQDKEAGEGQDEQEIEQDERNENAFVHDTSRCDRGWAEGAVACSRGWDDGRAMAPQWWQ